MAHVESIYKVCDENCSIDIESDADGLIRISTNDLASKEYWGEIDFGMSVEQANALANAILKKVKDIRESQ